MTANPGELSGVEMYKTVEDRHLRLLGRARGGYAFNPVTWEAEAGF